MSIGRADANGSLLEFSLLGCTSGRASLLELMSLERSDVSGSLLEFM